jgi:hypothetical protein
MLYSGYQAKIRSTKKCTCDIQQFVDIILTHLLIDVEDNKIK